MNKKVILFDIDYTLFDTDVFKKTQLKKHLVYNEVRDILAELAKVARLGIFSEGDLILQRTKLKKTDIHKYFLKEYTHIVEGKNAGLKAILDKYRNTTLFLVDDKLSILHMAKAMLPTLFTIWVKRGRYAEKQKPIPGFKPDAIVNDLSKLKQLITNN